MTLSSKGQLRPELYAARGGLCSRCRFARLVTSSKGNTLVMCRHEALPKYLPQPVLECPHVQLLPLAREALN